ncbi:sensor histidine kinase [Rhodohalobacter sp.]|uniref:sensor histidine kinase n=1 Tax=Rhodohalobacter sp. TaxID=1974210 RepID=UPI003567567D
MDIQKNDQSNTSDDTEQLQNIAQIINRNLELEKKYKLLSSRVEYLNNHVRNLKHDLQSPLGGIIGMLDILISDDKDRVNVETRDLKMIKDSAQSLLDLVDEEFVIGDDLQSEKQNINIDKRLSSAMKEIHRLYLPMAKNKGINLMLKNKIETEIELQSNLFLNLIQTTGNLIANAVKFTPSGGTVIVEFTLGAEDDRSMLFMSISDTGKSMSAEQVSAFNQGKPVARSLGTDGEEGSGIGLQHVKQMVFEVDGRIDVESEKGSGTTFSLSFPLPGINLHKKGAFHFVTKIKSVILNGSQS